MITFSNASPSVAMNSANKSITARSYRGKKVQGRGRVGVRPTSQSQHAATEGRRKYRKVGVMGVDGRVFRAC